MPAAHPSNSDTIVLTADDRAQKMAAFLYFVPVALFIFGVVLLSKEVWSAGGILSGYGIILLVGGLVKTTTSTTFDLARRDIIIKKAGLFRTTTQWAPFDAVQGLYIPPGRKGAVLLLKNGTTFKATDAPSNYIALDRRLADIRARIGIAAADPAPPVADPSRNITQIPSRPVIFTASRQSGLVAGVMCILIGCALAVVPLVIVWNNDTRLGGFHDPITAIAVGLVLLAFGGLFIAIGIGVFGTLTELVLIPESRQAHFVFAWPAIWPNDVIGFDEFAAAGVREKDKIGSNDTHDLDPYIRLKSGRLIELSGFGGAFRVAEASALLICKVTGAELRNVNVMEDYFAKAEDLRGRKYDLSKTK